MLHLGQLFVLFVKPFEKILKRNCTWFEKNMIVAKEKNHPVLHLIVLQLSILTRVHRINGDISTVTELMLQWYSGPVRETERKLHESLSYFKTLKHWDFWENIQGWSPRSHPLALPLHIDAHSPRLITVCDHSIFMYYLHRPCDITFFLVLSVENVWWTESKCDCTLRDH